MNVKRMAIFATVALMAATVFAAPTTTKRGKTGAAKAAAAEDDDTGIEKGVSIEVFPKLGRLALFDPPSLQGGSAIGTVYPKPRKWIVLETKYKTLDPLVDRLEFEWHVILDNESAGTKNKDKILKKFKRARYVYLTQKVSYLNIPKGSHAASVCLHPSYYEQFGEPKAIGLVIRDSTGEVVAGDCESQINGIKSHVSLEEAFWNNRDIMEAKTASGDPMIEILQGGLQDRSKTIWALVNPNDYELVVQ